MISKNNQIIISIFAKPIIFFKTNIHSKQLPDGMDDGFYGLR